jgi:hypothetical protein
MGKNRKRGGKKAHANRVKARNQKIESKKNAFVKQFKEQMDKGVASELEKQANDVKLKEIDGTEERTMDSTMSTSPINTSVQSK